MDPLRIAPVYPGELVADLAARALRNASSDPRTTQQRKCNKTTRRDTYPPTLPILKQAADVLHRLTFGGPTAHPTLFERMSLPARSGVEVPHDLVHRHTALAHTWPAGAMNRYAETTTNLSKLTMIYNLHPFDRARQHKLMGVQKFLELHHLSTSPSQDIKQ